MDDTLSPRELQLIGNDPPVTKTAFVEQMWNLHPIGNPSDAYIRICACLNYSKTFGGEKLTFGLLVSKWKEYIDYCKLSGRTTQFIKSLPKWLESEEWNATYDTSELHAKLDIYIKPQHDRDDQSTSGRAEATWADNE